MGSLGRAVYTIGFWIRETGQAVDRLGCRLQGNYHFQEQRESLLAYSISFSQFTFFCSFLFQITFPSPPLYFYNLPLKRIVAGSFGCGGGVWLEWVENGSLVKGNFSTHRGGFIMLVFFHKAIRVLRLVKHVWFENSCRFVWILRIKAGKRW